MLQIDKDVSSLEEQLEKKKVSVEYFRILFF